MLNTSKGTPGDDGGRGSYNSGFSGPLNITSSHDTTQGTLMT